MARPSPFRSAGRRWRRLVGRAEPAQPRPPKVAAAPAPGLRFDAYDPAFIADPYPTYHRLQTEAPVLRLPSGEWLLTRYADVARVLQDPATSAHRVLFSPTNVPTELADMARIMQRTLDLTLLRLDPPDHTRIRRLAVKAFTPRVVESLKGDIQRIVAELLDTALADGGMDVVGGFAFPLPTRVIARLLGFPESDVPTLKAWSDDLAEALGSSLETPGRRQLLVRGGRSMTDFAAYLQEAVAERRARPSDDLVTRMIRAEDEEGVLAADELIAVCMLVFVAGHETTTNLLGNGVLALLEHPGELRRLRADRGLLPSAVEEFLRFDSPVQITERIATADLELNGATIRKGAWITLMLGAANRDPEQFPDPDRLDLGREANRHLAFSHGAHYCIGAALARLEAQIAFGELLERAPSIRLGSGGARRHPNPVFRGLASFPVEFG